MVEISVIIPTYNRPITLQKVVKSYIEQKYVKELIIIDDGSTLSYEKTIKNILKLTEKKNIKLQYIKNKLNKGAAYCRNLGVWKATKQYILWGEDDVFLESNYTKKLVRHLVNNKYMILCGAIIYDISLKESLKNQRNIVLQQRKAKKKLFDYKKMEGYFRLNLKGKVEIPFGHALILVPKEVYRNIKYYEGYKYNGYREESDAQVQMVQTGYKIYYISDAICYHLKRDEVEGKSGQHKGDWLKYEIYKIKNNIIFFKRYGKYFRVKYHNKSKIVASNLLFFLGEINVIIKKLIKQILIECHFLFFIKLGRNKYEDFNNNSL